MKKIKNFLKLIRPHQWSKNLLLIVPLLASHKGMDSWHLLDLILAFVGVSFFASSGYVLNDLLDREADKKNSTKKIDHWLQERSVPLKESRFQ